MKKTSEPIPDLEYIQRWIKWYRKLGLNVIALPPKSKGRKMDYKWGEYHERRATDEEVKDMFNRFGTVALINGKTSRNAVSLDFDGKVGYKNYKKLADHFPDTFKVESKNGIHIHFTTDIMPPKANTKYKEQYGIEILSQGSLIVMPPSVHEDGDFVYKPYKGSKKPENNKPPAHIEGDFLQWIYHLIKEKIDKKFEPKQDVYDIDKLMQGVKEGKRNQACIVVATFYRRSGLDYDACYQKMMEWNQKNDPPCEGKDFDALERTIMQAYKDDEPYNYRYTRMPQQITFFPPEIREKAEKIVEEGKVFEYINKAAKLYHAGDEAIIRVEWISSVNCLSDDEIKINLWAIGRSQKGKTHSFYTVVLLVPREYREIFTSASPLSFFYYIKKYGEWALDKKLIFIDEFESSKHAEPILRSLTGQTPITPRHLSVFEAELIDLVIQGKRSVWLSSVKTFGSAQLKNRFTNINPDETIEQDDRVWEHDDLVYRQGKLPPDEPLQIAQAITQNIIENTAKLKVEIPYEIEWAYRSRRWLYKIFLMFIRTIARINYKKRQIKDDVLVATKEDFYETRRLWATFIESIIYRVSYTSQQILEILSDQAEEAMTHEEISRQIALSTKNIHKYCTEMVDEGLVSYKKRTEKGKRGRGSYEYWKAKIPSIDEIRLKGETHNGSSMLDIKLPRNRKKIKKQKNKKYPKLGLFNGTHVEEPKNTKNKEEWLKTAKGVNSDE